jgi:hypothetical protein
MYNSSLKYKIISFNETTGQIIVEPENMSPLAVDLPIENGKYIEGLQLDTYIRGIIPSNVSNRKEIVAGVTNKESIAVLVTQHKPSRDEILDIIRRRRNILLYNTDWTQTVPDYHISDELKEAMRVYRQELRDVTKQEDLENIKWPKNPYPGNIERV